MNILIYFEHAEISNFFSKTLRAAGHVAEYENKLEKALRKFLHQDFDLVITENIDEGDSYNFFRTLKIHKSTIKILAVSLFYKEGEMVKAMRNGADTYLEYPCSVSELLEKIEKLKPKEYQYFFEEPLKLRDLELYPNAYEAFRGGKKISLRKKEYQLLEFLLRNKNRVINRNTILEYIWNYDTSAITNTLDAHISSLRKKVDAHHDFKMIQTIYGAGYKLSDH